MMNMVASLTMKRTTKITKIDDYYCSQKFTWLTVDITRASITSCCAAYPEKINYDWLTDNTGQLFNTPILQQERKSMLANQPVSSCDICWQSESVGLESRRTIHQTQEKIHTDIVSKPKTLGIDIGTNCNLTCVYCCKHYSSSWAHDIIDNGNYQLELKDDKYTINNKDKILLKLGQQEILGIEKNQLLIQETVKLIPDADNIIIGGGEPFLYKELHSFLNKCHSQQNIIVHTGLGVNEKRFAKEIKKISSYGLNLTVSVSGENIQSLYEFVRNGNTWIRYKNNLQTIVDNGLKIMIHPTLSNLTILGLNDFFHYITDTLGNNFVVKYNNVTSPDFLSCNVLDHNSKNFVKDNLNLVSNDVKTKILKQIDVEPTENQIKNLKIFINEFARRKNLNLSIFPKSFYNWVTE